MEKYTHRYIARVVLEAQTPLFVGSGETSLITDALVQRDLHGFPMIQGTSLAGVLRHALEDNETDKQKWNSFFGYQAPTGKKGLGSQVKISSAYLILDDNKDDNKIAEGLNITEGQKKLQKYFENLPVRQHVRITDKGVALDKGLFDNEVVYKGCQFVFEIELKGNAENEKLWTKFLNQLKNPLFRIGQGTRNGYGKLSVNSCKTKVFNLENEDDFNSYLNYDISLNVDNKLDEIKGNLKFDKDLIHYRLQLKPENFFMFSAGFDDDEVDNIPVTEEVVSYENNALSLLKDQSLIPASSVKGALRHRAAFHYLKNLEKPVFADKLNKENYPILHKFYTETNNDAVYELFGAEEGIENQDKDKKYNLFKEVKGKRGKIIMNDLFLKEAKNDKIFNHVAIDRFTGGAMDGALFSEKVSYFDDENKEIKIDIYLDNSENIDKTVIEAFEETLKDVCKGLLPLGGMTTKGHGIFTGKFFINNSEKPEFDYEANK